MIHVVFVGLYSRQQYWVLNLIMQKKEISLVFYHVPQDRDDPEVPNVFSIPVSRQALQLKHIHQYFPLKGNYAFRFKVAYENFIVWLDLADPETEVPLFKDKIYLKANRLSWNEQKHQYGQSISQSAKIISKSQPLNLFDHNDEVVQIPKPKASNFPQMNLLGDHNEHHLSSQSQQVKIDFFAQRKLQQKKEVNLMGTFEHHGDLI